MVLREAFISDVLDQARTMSGPPATYGPPSIFMWPSSFINSYIDYKNRLNCKLNMTSIFLFCKQTCQSLQFFKEKPTDDI